jgi:hypothetical protein
MSAMTPLLLQFLLVLLVDWLGTTAAGDRIARGAGPSGVWRQNSNDDYAALLRLRIF